MHGAHCLFIEYVIVRYRFGSMPPMDSSASYYEGPWLLSNNSPVLFDVKSEEASFSNPLLNSSSGGESCMSKVEQVVYQRASNLSSAPHFSSLGDVSTIISDSLMQGGLDHLKPVKCAFSTITSAQRANPCLDALVSSVPMDSQLSEPTCFSRKDGWSLSGPSNPQPFTTGSFKSLGVGCLAKSGSFRGASAATESTTELQKESQTMGRNNVNSRSDDTSLDDIITTSSGVSSTSGYLPMEQEDDDGVCTTSEPSSQVGRCLPLGVTAGVDAIALAHKDEQQQQMSGLTGVSHCSDQRELGSSSSVSPGAQMDQESILSNDSGCFPMNDGVTIPSVVPVDVKPTQGDLGAIVGDGSWCTTESNEAVGSGGFLPGHMLNHANASTAPVGASSSLQRSTSSNICYPQNDTRNLAPLNATLNPVVADESVATFREAMVRGTSMKDHLTQDMLFRAPFASINMTEVENSRPKRRNVKISKDPQSVAARHRRERISDRIRILQRLVPGGTKMDTASMLDEAISYVKYLKAQVQTLETVSSATSSFDPRLNFGPASLYRTSFPGLPYSPMAIDCSSVSQGIGSGQIDFKDLREGFPPLCDGNYAVQFCH